jgi:hypothetical protein
MNETADARSEELSHHRLLERENYGTSGTNQSLQQLREELSCGTATEPGGTDREQGHA